MRAIHINVVHTIVFELLGSGVGKAFATLPFIVIVDSIVIISQRPGTEEEMGTPGSICPYKFHHGTPMTLIRLQDHHHCGRFTNVSSTHGYLRIKTQIQALEKTTAFKVVKHPAPEILNADHTEVILSSRKRIPITSY